MAASWFVSGGTAMSVYSRGTVRKKQAIISKQDGTKATRWVWQGVLTVTGEDGKVRHMQKNLRDEHGDLIEAAPDKGRSKGKRAKATGKGSDKALNALAAWRQSLIDAEQRAADDAKAAELAKAEEDERAKRLTVWRCVDEYIETSLAGGFIEASTATDYRMTAKRIRATLPDLPLDELTPQALNEWQAKLSTTHAHSTMKKTRNVLRVAIQDAMDNGRTTLVKNPVVTKRKTISQKRRDKASAPKLNALDKANRSVLLAELDGMTLTPVTVAAYVGLYAGLREAEACALVWSDVNLDGGFLNVNKAVGKADTGIYIKPQKNDATERDVPIHPELSRVLRRWHAQQAEVAMSLGVDVSKTFVIGNPSLVPPVECFAYLDGTDSSTGDQKLMGNASVYPEGIYQPARLSREWRALSKASRARGLLGRHVTYHNLRHSFGFYCANEGGVPIERLAEWLGHESIETTRKYYVAKDKELSRKTSREAMDSMIERGVVRDAPAEVVEFRRASGDE